eukprot:PLAT13746.2.p2 GENE.PLAT13746.2~~PLAT13746.2.p2  ORF type:complete len:171 (-),score=46.84 PLAT13746.2:41-553(-)
MSLRTPSQRHTSLWRRASRLRTCAGLQTWLPRRCVGSSRQLRRLLPCFTHLSAQARDRKLASRVEGRDHESWVAAAADALLVHCMLPEARQESGLEEHWATIAESIERMEGLSVEEVQAQALDELRRDSSCASGRGGIGAGEDGGRLRPASFDEDAEAVREEVALGLRTL